MVEALGDPRARPDRRWIAHLTGARPDRIRAVLAELRAFVPLERGIRRTLRAGGRSNYAQISGPLELYALVRLGRPRHVVETGVSSGISSAHLLLALRQNGGGTLHSIDQPRHQRGFRKERTESPVGLPPGRSPGWAVPPALRRGWDLRLGPSERRLPELVRELPRIDLFLHDDLHTPEHLAFELAVLRPSLGPGSVVLADNTLWTGRALERAAATWGAAVRSKGGTDLAGFRIGPRGIPPVR